MKPDGLLSVTRESSRSGSAAIDCDRNPGPASLSTKRTEIFDIFTGDEITSETPQRRFIVCRVDLRIELPEHGAGHGIDITDGSIHPEMQEFFTVE